METTIQNSAPVFFGEFVHAIDGKNRITIPAPWRFKEEVELFLIPSTSSNCLKVMGRAELERIRAQAAAMPGPQRAAFQRRLGSQGRQVMLDKSGRLSLPDEFCQQFKLSGEVTLSGALENFEVWNTDEWNAAHASTKAVGDALMSEFGL
jgi:division/cell wall cluster transcriptional repressor MraZ